MFYRANEHHGLRHSPFYALVVPRPIGWISTVDAQGNVNLAPYSFFNAVAYKPPQVMCSSSGQHEHGGLKDTTANIEATKEFVVNMATWDLREAMNLSSAPAPHDVDEFEIAGLTPEPSELVAPPRIKESPVHLECRYTQSVELLTAKKDQRNIVILGEVIGIHISDDVIVDGMVSYERMQPIGRLGYMDYVRVTDTFAIMRPGWPLKESAG